MLELPSILKTRAISDGIGFTCVMKIQEAPLNGPEQMLGFLPGDACNLKSIGRHF